MGFNKSTGRSLSIENRGVPVGFRFRKSVRFGPLRVNLGKRGIGTSIGVPGARITNSSSGRKYLTLGIPGTGLSWTKTLNSRRARIAQPDTPEVIESQSDRSSNPEEIKKIDSADRPPAPLEFD